MVERLARDLETSNICTERCLQFRTNELLIISIYRKVTEMVHIKLFQL